MNQTTCFSERTISKLNFDLPIIVWSTLKQLILHVNDSVWQCILLYKHNYKSKRKKVWFPYANVTSITSVRAENKDLVCDQIKCYLVGRLKMCNSIVETSACVVKTSWQCQINLEECVFGVRKYGAICVWARQHISMALARGDDVECWTFNFIVYAYTVRKSWTLGANSCLLTLHFNYPAYLYWHLQHNTCILSSNLNTIGTYFPGLPTAKHKNFSTRFRVILLQFVFG